MISTSSSIPGGARRRWAHTHFSFQSKNIWGQFPSADIHLQSSRQQSRFPPPSSQPEHEVLGFNKKCKTAMAYRSTEGRPAVLQRHVGREEGVHHHTGSMILSECPPNPVIDIDHRASELLQSRSYVLAWRQCAFISSLLVGICHLMRKTLCNFEPQLWLEISTPRHAKKCLF